MASRRGWCAGYRRQRYRGARHGHARRCRCRTRIDNIGFEEGRRLTSLPTPDARPGETSSPRARVRIAVLASGRGSNLKALLAAIDADPSFPGEVVVVAGDIADAGAIDIARDYGIAVAVQPVNAHDDRTAWEAALVEDLRAHQVEIVVLAGFMRIVSPAFLSHWPDRVINTHPSLLPAFRGAHAVRDALAHGVKVTGATVHFVIPELDAGPIIAQHAVTVGEDDDEATLHDRIRRAEHDLLPQVVRWMCEGRLRVEGDRVAIEPCDSDADIAEDSVPTADPDR